MQEHRLIGASSVEKYSFGAPFSCFEYVEREFGGEPSIHRCFSLARSSKAKRLLVEDIPERGIIAEEYKNHLRGLSDWNGHREDSDLLDSLFQALPARVWMVEISLPHLFPANERKLGEILFDATIREGAEEVDFRALVFVRLPCRYFLLSQQTDNLDFSTIPSKIDSHTALFNT